MNPRSLLRSVALSRPVAPLTMWALRKRDARLPDMEIRQLRALQAAYAGPSGPDILLLGDSTMFWTRAGESDQRTLARMLEDDLGASVHSIVGPGYNPRLAMAYLDVLAGCSARPKVVVTPTSLMMATSSWLEHPRLSYEVESDAIRALAAAGDTTTERLPRPPSSEWDRYDRLPAPSLYGARRTFGEIRMITNAIPATTIGLPTTNWQHFVRVRHLLDLSNAEALTSESLGVRLVGDLAAQLATMGLRSVACIAPVNHQTIGKVFSAEAVEHVRRNAAVVESAYRERGGALAGVANGAFICPTDEFTDPSHLNEAGRTRFAALLGAELRVQLDAAGGDR